MKAWSPIYEGDSIIHYRGALTLPEAAPTIPETGGRSAFAAIGDAVRGLFRWLERSAERARYRQLEGYLAESSDVFDLERRIRNLERSYSAFDPYS